MRMTIDIKENEAKQNRYLTDKFAEIIKAMGANRSRRPTGPRPTTSRRIRRRI